MYESLNYTNPCLATLCDRYSLDSVMDNALACHLCDPGSNPGQGMWQGSGRPSRFGGFLAHLSRQAHKVSFSIPMLRRPSVRPSSVRRPSVRRPPFSKIFFSETAWPIKAKFYMKHLWEGGTNVYINNPGHMTRWPPCPYMVKTLQNLLLRNHWTDFNQTWHEALMTQVLQCVYKS